MTDFLSAYNRAGKAFIPAKGKDPAVEGKDLSDFLLSEEPLTKGHRVLLAALVRGEAGNKKGQRKMNPWDAKPQRAASLYLEKLKEGWREQDAIIKYIEDTTNLSTRTVRNHLNVVWPDGWPKSTK